MEPTCAEVLAALAGTAQANSIRMDKTSDRTFFVFFIDDSPFFSNLTYYILNDKKRGQTKYYTCRHPGSQYQKASRSSKKKE